MHGRSQSRSCDQTLWFVATMLVLVLLLCRWGRHRYDDDTPAEGWSAWVDDYVRPCAAARGAGDRRRRHPGEPPAQALQPR